MDVPAGQSVLDKIRLFGNLEHALADLLRIDGRTGISIDHDEERLSIDLTNGDCSVRNLGIEPQGLLKIVGLDRAASAEDRQQAVLTGMITTFDINGLIPSIRQRNF